MAAPEPGPATAEFRNELTALVPFLRAFARSLCGNPSDADDLAQEALVKAWRARDRFEPGTNLKAWTFMILRNHFYSERRKAWRRNETSDETIDATSPTPSTQAAMMELAELRRALTQLPDEQREALILVGAGGFAYEEAAAICGCAVGTIKSRVSRARRTLVELVDTGTIGRSEKPDAMDAAEGIINEALDLASGHAA